MVDGNEIKWCAMCMARLWINGQFLVLIFVLLLNKRCAALGFMVFLKCGCGYFLKCFSLINI
jgi:hypothetical protein